VNKLLDNVAVYRRPLAPGEVTKIYHLEGRYELLKLVTAPFAAQPPKIDGIFDAGEWDGAAEIRGFMDVQTGKPWNVEDAVRLQYDKDKLYFAYHCPPPASIAGNAPMIAAMLSSAKTGKDTNVEADDALWIHIVKPHPGGDIYNLCVNGANTHYDFTEGGTAPGSIEKGIDIHWNPAWITASTVTMDGWKLEGAIPFKDLKMETPKPGQLLHVNFTRYWRTILGGVVSWAYGQPYDEMTRLNYYAPTRPIRFGEPGGVAVRLERIGNLVQGALDVRATVVNAGPSPARVRAEIASNSGEIEDSQTIEVPANGSAPYAFKSRVVKPETGMVELRVADAATGALLFVSAHPILRADHPSVYLRKYPSWSLVKFETEFDALSATPPGQLEAELTVTPAKGGKPLVRRKAGPFDRYAHTFELSTKNLAAGAYVAEAKFRHGRRLLDTVRQEFEVKPLPEWYNNTIGCDDPRRTPHPFSHMELRENRDATVWGRIYRWDDSLLPAQIEVNPGHDNPMTPTPAGRGILRGPMRLAGRADGTDFSTERLKAAFEWTEKLPTRIAGTRWVTNGNLAITADVNMEFDGFCWVKLTLAPVKGTVELQSLAFEEPFTPEFSDVANMGEYSLVGTGKFPDKFTQKSAILPIWVGNGEGGLQTFVDTMATWSVKDLQTTLQLMPGQEGGTMRYNLVDRTLTLSKPRTIAFGFSATPTRIKDWRTWREPTRGRRSSHYAWYPGEEWNVGDLGWVQSYHNGGGPQPRADWGAWVYNQPYMNTDYVPVNDPDVQEFGDEWLANAEDRWRDKIGLAGHTLHATYHSKSYRDWVVWKMHELFRRQPFGGWYYDVVSPVASANPYAGAGVVLEDGTRRPTTALLGLREVTKRLYTMCRFTYPDGETMFHSSGMPNMAYMAFGEIFWDGENLGSSINAQQPTYRGVLTPERFRAEYMGHNFGPKLLWLGQARIKAETAREYGPDAIADHVAGLQLLHDSPVNAGGGFGGTVFGADGAQLVWHCDQAEVRVYKAIRRYDLYSPGYRFVPYWRQNAAAGLKDRQFVSWYVRQPVQTTRWDFWTREETDESLPHRVIGIFCNESDWKGEMAVQVDLKKLGFAEGATVTAVNAVHSTGYRIENANTPQEQGAFFSKSDETAILTGNELRFPMSEWNFRMIVLEE
ncbi:MAG: DUF6067 family protein, partial [Kiritimatiellae bacterium]|nr:DUF6067 family protein [Kiritimatiellia bacterium]